MSIGRSDRLDRELAELADAPREVLVERWRVAYGRAPTSGTRRELLIASAAWHLQARRLGGLSRETKRRLTREMERVASGMKGRDGSAAARTDVRQAELAHTMTPIARVCVEEGGGPTARLDESAAATADASPTLGPRLTADDAGDDDASAVNTIAAAGRSGDRATRTPARAPMQRRSVLPGARLLRDWNGVTHAVDVVESGYLYDGRIHRSLSAIARTITGAHWSGPRFFGI